MVTCASGPKDRVSEHRPDLALPLRGVIEQAKAHADGARKYGRYNWREEAVAARVCLKAIRRHLELLEAGEDYAEDSGIHHLGHIMATAAVMLDAEMCGKLIDDRDYSTGSIRLLKDAYQWFAQLGDQT